MANGRQHTEKLLNEIVRKLGREDIGVGDIVLAGRSMFFTIWKGRRRLRSQIPFRAPVDHMRVARDLASVLVAFNRLGMAGWRRGGIAQRRLRAASPSHPRAIAVSR